MWRQRRGDGPGYLDERTKGGNARSRRYGQPPVLAFFRSQVDTKLRRSLIQRARVKRSEYAPGEMVRFFRHDKASTKRGRWRGPGLVLGREGPNWWVSYAGRCHLCAEEHMRPSTAEEVGDAFTSRVARADLEKLLFSDPHDPNSYADNEEEDYEEPGDDENPYRGWDIVVDEDEHMESVEHKQQTAEVPDEELDQLLETPPELQERQSRVLRRARHKQAGRPKPYPGLHAQAVLHGALQGEATRKRNAVEIDTA